MLKDLWNYYEEQYLVVNGVLGQQPWFFTESCFGSASYWTTLAYDPALEPYKLEKNYTMSEWTNQLCQVYQLC